MVSVRQDAWKESEDLLLAETVLQYIRNGQTQLQAFEKVSEALNRSTAACGFRWNAGLRERYKLAINEAKAHRKQAGRTKVKVSSTPAPADQQIRTSGNILRTIEGLHLQVRNLVTLNESLLEENLLLRQQMLSLEVETERLQQVTREHIKEKERMQEANHKHSLHEDYQALIRILQKAREVGVLSEDEKTGYAFRMDEHGNLDKIG